MGSAGAKKLYPAMHALSGRMRGGRGAGRALRQHWAQSGRDSSQDAGTARVGEDGSVGASAIGADAGPPWRVWRLGRS